MDEVGFSMTASTYYSWSPVGQRLYVPYEAPQGRRINAIGALFHHSQRFEFLTRAKVPKCKKKPIPKAAEGLEASELSNHTKESGCFSWG